MEILNENEVEEVSGGKKYDYFTYTVVPDDSLSMIALRFGTTVNVLMRLNPQIKNPDLIKVGWQLKIPTSNKVGWM